MQESTKHTATPADASWSDEWTVGIRVWVDRAGHAILGKGRLELLEGIDRWHSISEAARQMGMSYRRAWTLVQSANEAAGEPLVEAATGGTGGGGAQLTPRGRVAVSVFRELQNQIQPAAGNILKRLVRRHTGELSLHLSAAVSLQEVVGQLLADYAFRQPHVSIRTLFGASDELADNLLAGGAADLILVADPRELDRLDRAELLARGARKVLAQNGLAVVAAPRRKKPPIRKAADLLRPEVARIAVASPNTPLGGYTRAYLESVGLYDRLLPRLLHVDNSHAVLPAVHAERADVGLVFQSDAVKSTSCRLLFAVRKLPQTMEYAGAVVDRGQPLEPARALLDFFASKAAEPRFRSCGFLPHRARAD